MSTRATEDQLAALHKRVAETFIAALEQSEEANLLLVTEWDTPLPTRVMNFLRDCAATNPSLLTAATKFLKDNSISADPGADEGIGELQQQLADKRNKNKGNISRIPLDL